MYIYIWKFSLITVYTLELINISIFLFLSSKLQSQNGVHVDKHITIAVFTRLNPTSDLENIPYIDGKYSLKYKWFVKPE